MSEGTETSVRTGRRSPLLALLAVLIVAVVVGLVAYLLVRDDDDELDLRQGLAGVEVDAEVEGDDLEVVDTVQGVGVFVQTADGPVYVRYGDLFVDRFGIGTVVDVEGEVRSVQQLAPEEREQVDGDFFVMAEEIDIEG